MSRFIDRVSIKVKAGNGGNGCKSFYRDKSVCRGIPDGGSGGNGGDVYIQGNSSINTLIELSYNEYLYACDGVNGSSNQKNGSNGDDLTIQVPIGTECQIDDRNISILNSDPILLLKGAQGTNGNSLWRKFYEEESLLGKKCDLVNIDLQVKTIGDVGLVGFPNAGKSSFLNKISNADVEVGDYEFTTIRPHLGMWNKIVFVDIPGIIEQAHQGKGMGFQFLSHIERCKFLLFMIDGTNINTIEKTYEILQNELMEYNINKPFLIILNKVENTKRHNVRKIRKILGNNKVYFISIHRNVGINKVLNKIYELKSKIC